MEGEIKGEARRGEAGQQEIDGVLWRRGEDAEIYAEMKCEDLVVVDSQRASRGGVRGGGWRRRRRSHVSI